MVQLTRRGFLQGLIAAAAASTTASASRVFPLQSAEAAEVVAEEAIGQVCWTVYRADAHLYLHGRMVGYDIASRRTLVGGDAKFAEEQMLEIEKTLRAKVVELHGPDAALPINRSTLKERQAARKAGDPYQ